MSAWVSYQGKPIGRIKINDNGSNKFVFIAEGLEALALLFSLQSNDKIEVDGMWKIPYSQFQRDYLRRINSFYPTLDDWLFKCEIATSVKEYESHLSIGF